MKQKKLTITVGIPAHNEGENIGVLLDSIKKQRERIFTIEKIIVACDGCTDNTAEVVLDHIRKDKRVVLLNDKKRKGKSERLNMLYRRNKSDYLLTFDADVVLDRDTEIERMVKKMLENSKTNVVGGRFIPSKQITFMGKLSSISYQSFEDAMLRLNDGNNMFALVGAASLMRKELAKSFTYPKGTISDQNYLYVMATKNNPEGVAIAKDTRIFLATVSTFKDWRILGVRSTATDKNNIMRFFGKKVLKNYSMPRHIFALSLMKFFFKSPIYTIGSVLMNVYIRKFPYKSASPRKGIWDLTRSSKHLILT